MRELDRSKFDELKLRFEEESQTNEESNISGGTNELLKEDAQVEDDPALSGRPKSPIYDATTAKAMMVPYSKRSVTSSSSSSSSSSKLSCNDESAKRRKIEVLYQCAMDNRGESSIASTTAHADVNLSTGNVHDEVEHELKPAAKKSPPGVVNKKLSASQESNMSAGSYGQTDEENNRAQKNTISVSSGSNNSNQVQNAASSPTSQNSFPSSFNIFCQLERAFILQRELHIESGISHDNEFNAKNEGFSVNTTNNDDDAVGTSFLVMPSRYDGLFIPARFYFAYSDKDLKDAMFHDVRLPNEVICTYDLSECIARRWLKEG